jgi:dTDP-4-dehydrorhamnose reductase
MLRGTIPPMTTVLVTGVYGQLGRAVAKLAEVHGATVHGHDLDTLDITDAAAVKGVALQVRPDVVVNCAAYTAVDDCETDEETATVVNGTAVGHLADACETVGARLIHISTDYVFSGEGSKPYLESDPVSPAGAYGRSKLVGEQLATRTRNHLTVRTAWLYGRGGRNFVEAIRSQIDRGATELRVVSDQLGSPTFGDDLAAAILALMGTNARGIVHACNSGQTTWHGFAVEIARLLGSEVPIHAVATSEFPRPAKRPPYSVLDTTRLASLIGHHLPPWPDALARYLEAS